MNQQLDLSIIIPTHNRRELLHQVLESLTTQSFPVHRFEVIVVADACEDSTEEMVNEISSTLPYKIRIFSHVEKSASATRNRGVQEAQSRHILFLDDDVIACRQLVASHMDLAGENLVVLGYSKPVIPDQASWWQRNARLWWEETYHEMRSPGHRFYYRDFFSGNVSLSIELFELVGRFDPAIRGRLEDYDLGYRLLKAGAQFVYQPLALGFHHDFTDLELWLKRIRQEAESMYYMGRSHTDITNNILSLPYRGHDRIKRIIHKLAFNQSRLATFLARISFRMADLSEFLRLRGIYWHVTGALREYYYWQGIATASGGEHNLDKILQEAPLSEGLDFSAPELDFATIPDEETISDILASAECSGLRITYDGVEIMTLKPEPGSESLRFDHVNRLFKTYVRHNFLPALAFSQILGDVKYNGN